MITTEGRNWLLENDAQAATLYVSILADSNFAALAEADTMSSHAGWEESTAYSEGARPQITFAAAANGSIKNTTSVSLTLTAATTYRGFFVTTNSTKGGTTGTLIGTGLLPVKRTGGVGEVVPAVVSLDLFARAS